MAEKRPDGETTRTVEAHVVDVAVDATLPSEPTAPGGKPAAALPPIDPGLYERDREIARGGMGRIVAARDRRLGRFVAIKELLPGREGLRRRFAREARIAARLQHPSIVPVHEGGVWPDGLPFYAMKLIVGESLEAALQARPTLAGRLELLPNVIAVCDALAYAHSRRVVHRDLKPQNVVLGEFGETVVVDWGLAKDLGSTDDARDGEPGGPASGDDAADAESTRAGTVMGTPAYMAQEQAQGEALDERVDVYALGAILYRLVSGAPPVAGDSVTEIVAAARAGQVRPLAEREPACPPDLAAIVDKATAADRSKRYRHAGELVADLKRFQTGQLVGAHRYSTGELVRRWMRRHRAALTVGAILALLLLVVSTVAAVRVVAERDTARRERAVAETQRHGAERLVEFMLSSLREKLDAIGRLDALVGAATSVLDYYESVGATGDAETLDRRADALLVLGDAEDEAGSPAPSLRAYRDALALRDQLAGLAPGDDENQWGRLRLIERLAVAAVRENRFAEARAGYQRALAALGPLLDRHPKDGRFETGFALLVQQLADCERLQGDLPAALALIETSRRRSERFADPGALLQTDNTLGGLQDLAGDFDAARRSFARASAAGEAWVAGAPRDARALQALVKARLDEGEALVDAALFADGEKVYRRAIEVAERLVGLDPAHAHNRWLFSKGETGLAAALSGGGRDAEAILVARRAVAIRETLVQAEPESQLWRTEIANAEARLGGVLLEAGRRDEARPHLVRARDAFAKLLDGEPTDVDLANDLELAERQLGDVELHSGDVGVARASIGHALALAQMLFARAPANLRYRTDLGAMWLAASALPAPSGDRSAPELAAMIARDLLGSAPAGATDAPFVATWASSWRVLAEKAYARVAHAEARDDALEALRHLEPLVAERPDDPALAESFARTLGLLAELQVRADTAEATAERAVRALAPLAAAGRLNPSRLALLGELRRSAGSSSR